MYVEKIIGPPGTGKTATLIGRVEEELGRGVAPERLGYYSFTRAAARVARQRAMATFPSYSKDSFSHFRTLHSEVFQQLDLTKDMVMAGKNLQEFSLAFGYEISKADIEDQNLEEYEGREAVLKNLGDYLLFFTNWRANLLLEFELAYPDFWELYRDTLPDGWSLGVVRLFEERYWGYKEEKVLLDFNDMLTRVLEEELHPDLDVLVFDEAQDSSPLQYRVLDFWLQGVKRHYLAGDPDQCLVAGSSVSTITGIKAIEAVNLFDKVACGTGGGKWEYGPVVNKGKRHYKGDVVKITLASGQTVIATPEHKLFWAWPSHGECGFHYVYLMKRGKDWRLGICKNPLVRRRCERTAEGILPVAAFDSREEAHLHELAWSLKYGIPTAVFYHRGGYSNNFERKLFDLIDSGAGAECCLADLGKDWKGALRAQAITAGSVARSVVNLEVLGEDGGKLRKLVYWEKMRVRGSFQFKSLEKARQKAEIIAGENTAEVVEHWGFLPNRRIKFLPVPAASILPGCLLPVVEGSRVGVCKVVKVERAPYEGVVYNLEVEPGNNFAVDGVFVGNCIYQWMGTNPDILMGRACDKLTSLNQSYRVPIAVHRLATGIIHTTTGYKPRPALGEVLEVSLDGVLKRFVSLNGSTAFILVRNLYLLRDLIDELYYWGIPFENLRGPAPFRGKTATKIVIARKLFRGELVSAEDLWLFISKIVQKRYFLRGVKAKVQALAKEQPQLSVGLGEIKKSCLGTFLDDPIGALGLSPRNRAYFKRVIERYGESVLLEKPRLTIGTIHSVKGMEADWVAICPDMSKKTWLGWQRLPEEEKRVWYVAVTRAREGLLLIHPESEYCWTWPKVKPQLDIDTEV